MEIGKNVKKYRELRGFTLPDLAVRAGVSKAFLWEIETGNSKRPGAELLYKIAEALGVTIAHLMGKGSGDDPRALIEPEIKKQTSSIRKRANGIIEWNLTLAPGAKKELHLKFTVQYPKDVEISNLY